MALLNFFACAMSLSSKISAPQQLESVCHHCGSASPYRIDAKVIGSPFRCPNADRTIRVVRLVSSGERRCRSLAVPPSHGLSTIEQRFPAVAHSLCTRSKLKLHAVLRGVGFAQTCRLSQLSTQQLQNYFLLRKCRSSIRLHGDTAHTLWFG